MPIVYANVDIYGSPALKDRYAALVGSELGGARLAEEILRAIDFESGGTKIIGGFVDGELVTINAFMPMRFHHQGATVLGYQSGYSATDSGHRGKGYWPRLMKFAEEHLASAGAAFLYGFPNGVSYPLFVHKLGYQSVDTFDLRIACLSLSFDRAFTSSTLAARPGAMIHPDFDDCLAWKRRADTDRSVVAVEQGDGRMWGKLRHGRKLGLPIHYLEVGTFELHPGGDLRRLLRAAAREAGVRLLYVTMNRNNFYFPLLRFARPGLSALFKPIGGFDPGGDKLNFFGGLRDTF